MTSPPKQKTLILFKPDCLQRNLNMEVYDMCLDAFGSDPVCMKLVGNDLDQRFRAHYAEHEGKHFYDNLISAMVVPDEHIKVFVFEGVDAIRVGRDLVKKVRDVHSLGGPNNTIHASDSQESARREIGIWFE